MKTGMLWLIDKKNSPLAEKIIAAAKYYQGKYGRLPDQCELHHSAIGESEKLSDVEQALSAQGMNISLSRNGSILKDHLLIGMREA